MKNLALGGLLVAFMIGGVALYFNNNETEFYEWLGYRPPPLR